MAARYCGIYGCQGYHVNFNIATRHSLNNNNYHFVSFFYKNPSELKDITSKEDGLILLSHKFTIMSKKKAQKQLIWWSCDRLKTYN